MVAVVVLEEIEVLRRDWLAQRLTSSEIKKEIRRLLFKHHPDRNRLDRVGAEERTRVILDLYRSVNEGPVARPTHRARADREREPEPVRPITLAQQFLLFMIAGESFACDVRWVLGVRNLRDLKTGSGALPKWIHDRQGIFVLDASRRSAGSAAPFETGQAVLLRIGASSKAFAVDRVDGVVSVEPDQFFSREGVKTFSHRDSRATVIQPAFFGL